MATYCDCDVNIVFNQYLDYKAEQSRYKHYGFATHMVYAFPPNNPMFHFVEDLLFTRCHRCRRQIHVDRIPPMIETLTLGLSFYVLSDKMIYRKGAINHSHVLIKQINTGSVATLYEWCKEWFRFVNLYTKVSKFYDVEMDNISTLNEFKEANEGLEIMFYGPGSITYRRALASFCDTANLPIKEEVVEVAVPEEVVEEVSESEEVDVDVEVEEPPALRKRKPKKHRKERHTLRSEKINHKRFKIIDDEDDYDAKDYYTPSYYWKSSEKCVMCARTLVDTNLGLYCLSCRGYLSYPKWSPIKENIRKIDRLFKDPYYRYPLTPPSISESDSDSENDSFHSWLYKDIYYPDPYDHYRIPEPNIPSSESDSESESDDPIPAPVPEPPKMSMAKKYSKRRPRPKKVKVRNRKINHKRHKIEPLEYDGE